MPTMVDRRRSILAIIECRYEFPCLAFFLKSMDIVKNGMFPPGAFHSTFINIFIHTSFLVISSEFFLCGNAVGTRSISTFGPKTPDAYPCRTLQI